MKLFYPLVLLFLFSCGETKQQIPLAKETGPDIDSMINLFTGIAHGDAGFHPAMMGNSIFFPLEANEHGNPSVWSSTDSTEETLYTPPQSNEALKQVIALGPRVIPFLVQHLSDKRKTQYTIEHKFGMGGMVYLNQYDYNTITTQDTLFLAAVNKRTIWDAFMGTSARGEQKNNAALDTLPRRKYTLMVGDICLVALGQIVNRNFYCVRYQPSAIYLINSPVLMPELVKACTHEWGKLTTEKHKQSLINDLTHRDQYQRDMGAYKRLLFYYPDEITRLKKGEWKQRIDSLETEWKQKEPL